MMPRVPGTASAFQRMIAASNVSATVGQLVVGGENQRVQLRGQLTSLDEIRHLPFGRCQHVGMRWAATVSSHGHILARGRGIFPPPAP